MLLAVALLLAPASSAAPLGSTVLGAQEATEPRTVLSVRYKDGSNAKLELAGTPRSPRTFGKLETEARKGAVAIKLKMTSLDPASRFGPYYNTVVLWGITPEGQATSLGEIPAKPGKDVLARMPVLQFGLMLTAEPYGSVTRPSPMVLAENSLGRKPDKNVGTSQTSYRGVSDALYEPAPEEQAALAAEVKDRLAPSVRQARRALTIAERAGAPQYANEAYGRARAKLAEVEMLSKGDKRNEKKAAPVAREAIRMAEFARVTALKAAEDARLAAEADRARADTEMAKAEADRARADTEMAKAEAERARAEAEKMKAEAERARVEAQAAQRDAAEAAQAKGQAERNAAAAAAGEQAARQQAESAARDAELARRERDAAHEKLYQSLNAILETRRETRGLIVNMSDVLFDFGKSTLRPEAREKLSRLAGVLMAYPQAYTLQFEGHTDAIGSDEFNRQLSQARAEAVRGYMSSAGIPATRVGSAVGYGKTRPVASNDTDAGRASNRRVEIVIDDRGAGKP